MTPRILRHVAIALFTGLASVAWAEALYMFSEKNGEIYFKGAPNNPRFASHYPQSRIGRRQRLRQMALNPVKPGYSSKAYFEQLVDEVARNYQIESALLHAVILVESRYNANALSPSGAAGLMQLMPATARRYGVNNALDPEQNLRGGARYLRDLLNAFGSDIQLAVAAYHAGEYAVARHNRVPPLHGTVEYVAKVLEHYQMYRTSGVH